jgi:hypothetical protein
MPAGDVHMSTPEDVARWMLDELQKAGYLYQWEAILEIQSRFGDDFTYLNESGNFAIDRRVLRAFRYLTEDTVVWRRKECCWARRAPRDPPRIQAHGSSEFSRIYDAGNRASANGQKGQPLSPFDESPV